MMEQRNKKDNVTENDKMVEVNSTVSVNRLN